jgi:hypothetical protein
MMLSYIADCADTSGAGPAEKAPLEAACGRSVRFPSPARLLDHLPPQEALSN